MKLGDAQSPLEAATNLLVLRRYQPFRFGGKWFVSAINGIGYAYRNQRDLLNVADKAGLASLEIATV